MDPRLRAAVDASACWYNELSALHAIGHRTADGIWSSLGPPPPLHSAAKSVQPWATSERALGAVAAYEHCSIADSFGTLSLPGFDVLFEARWLFREQVAPMRSQLPAGWAPIRTAADLQEWTAHHDTTGVLLPGLLNRPGFTVLGRRQEQLQAGAILHACGGVVSLSNVWTAPGVDPGWRELVEVAQAIHPGIAIVGYEHGDDLGYARAADFVDIGPQLVWAR